MRRSLVLAAVLCFVLIMVSASSMTSDSNFHFPSDRSYNVPPAASASSYYNGEKAVEYGMMVFENYSHMNHYPAGINVSVMQKNLDSYDSEDCAHFVSEALIAGGLTALASNPPGDNLTNYGSGYPGSYGIVGVYRLADWIAGYDLSVFPDNATEMQTVGYQPIPASYAGSPQAAVFYVFNRSMLPSYFLSPGDVIMDGGAGNGHAMLYIGNDQVVQKDPAALWNYSPEVDANISFYGMLTYLGKNVTAIYMHIPTFVNPNVRVTVLNNYQNVTGNITKLKSGEKLTFIGSYPNGVGSGNYTYKWLVNGRVESTGQFFNFTPVSGNYKVEVVATGSTGSVNESVSFSVGNTNNDTIPVIIAVLVIVITTAIVVYARRRK